MNPNNKPILYSARDPSKCERLKISEGVWECLRKGACKFSYSYGGDRFCKHPTAIIKAKPLSLISPHIKTHAPLVKY